MASFRIRIARAAVTASLLLMTTACAAPIGDFGRPTGQPPFGIDMSMFKKGLNKTDQEREMHDRIWRYLTAPEAATWFVNLVIGPQPMKLDPEARKKADEARYYHWLSDQVFASSRSRYNKLTGDIIKDVASLPAVFRSICSVKEVDRQRRVAADGLTGIDGEMLGQVAERKADNDAAVESFVWALGFRYDSYGFALDHLLVETPHEEAKKSNALLTQLGVYLEAAAQGDFCTAHDVGGARTSGGAVPSRIEQGDGGTLPPK